MTKVSTNYQIPREAQASGDNYSGLPCIVSSQKSPDYLWCNLKEMYCVETGSSLVLSLSQQLHGIKELDWHFCYSAGGLLTVVK